MQSDHNLYPNHIDLELVIKQSQAAVRACLAVVRRATVLLDEPGQRVTDTPSLPVRTEIDVLLKGLQHHEERLQTLALALFQPNDAKQFH